MVIPLHFASSEACVNTKANCLFSFLNRITIISTTTYSTSSLTTRAIDFSVNKWSSFSYVFSNKKRRSKDDFDLYCDLRNSENWAINFVKATFEKLFSSHLALDTNLYYFSNMFEVSNKHWYSNTALIYCKKDQNSIPNQLILCLLLHTCSSRFIVFLWNLTSPLLFYTFTFTRKIGHTTAQASF